MTCGSLFAGIGGFDAGLEAAGLRVLWQVEREPFCQRVLAKHFPHAVIYDDVMTATNLPRVDVLCGGFPCQDVSVAGKRAGLAGARTGLFWEFMRLIDELQPEWVIVENVAGLLTSHRGRDFHTVLTALAERGLGFSYRIFDSRYFGVAQRRRRVFIVGCRGDAERARAVLFESTRGGGDSPTRRPSRARVAPCLESGANRTGGHRPPGSTVDTAETLQVVGTLKQRMRGATDEVMDSLQVAAFNWQSGGDVRHQIGTKTSALSVGQTPAIYEHGGDVQASSGERARALTASMHKHHDDDTDTLLVSTLTATAQGGWRVGADEAAGGQLVASSLTASAGHHGHSSPRGDGQDNLVAFALNASHGTQIGQGHNTTYPIVPQGVRRLTPLECERLQGFPDAWTCLCGVSPYTTATCRCPDSPRYRALGNAVTRTVAEWIGRRLMAVAESERVA